MGRKKQIKHYLHRLSKSINFAGSFISVPLIPIYGIIIVIVLVFWISSQSSIPEYKIYDFEITIPGGDTGMTVIHSPHIFYDVEKGEGEIDFKLKSTGDINEVSFTLPPKFNITSYSFSYENKTIPVVFEYPHNTSDRCFSAHKEKEPFPEKVLVHLKMKGKLIPHGRFLFRSNAVYTRNWSIQIKTTKYKCYYDCIHVDYGNVNLRAIPTNDSLIFQTYNKVNVSKDCQVIVFYLNSYDSNTEFLKNCGLAVSQGIIAGCIVFIISQLLGWAAKPAGKPEEPKIAPDTSEEKQKDPRKKRLMRKHRKSRKKSLLEKKPMKKEEEKRKEEKLVVSKEPVVLAKKKEETKKQYQKGRKRKRVAKRSTPIKLT